MLESLRENIPVFYPIKQWMIVLDITIPWLFEEDTTDTSMTEIICIFERIIDHKSNAKLFTEMGFW
jgi:hypothetical protein